MNTFMISSITYNQIIIAKCAFTITLLSYSLFWVWIISNINTIWIIWLAILLLIDQIFHLHVLWMIPYMTKINKSDNENINEIPLRIAMIATKTPSEPFNLLSETLTAMLKQIYPYSYDVWLADEQVTETTTQWCNENNVKISCRYGLPEYHKKEWPCRTKCKEGNLRYFYDIHSNEYDVVFQFDSDHAPEPGYLASAMPIFADSTVAYLAFPSISDGGSHNSWISRARLNSEAFNYGPLQTAYSYYLMPNMTGSHYAVRVNALNSIGGIGPELDEDLSTSMMFASHDMRGVYSPDTIAHGKGPECFEDAMKQEFQWSRSATILYLRWRHIIFPSSEYRKKITFKIWLRLYTTCIWYITCISWFLWIVISPIMAYIFGWCKKGCIISLIDIIIHIMPIPIISFGTLLWCKNNNWLRPKNAIILSPMIILYKLIRIIWISWGCISGIIEVITGRTSPIAVTPKGNDGSRILSFRTLIPIYIMIIIQLVAFYLPILISKIGHISLDYIVSVFLILQMILLNIAIFIIIFMHYFENHISITIKKIWPWRNMLTHFTAMFIITSIIIVTIIIEWHYINNLTLYFMFIPKFYTPFDMLMMISSYGLSFLWTGSMIIIYLYKNISKSVGNNNIPIISNNNDISNNNNISNNIDIYMKKNLIITIPPIIPILENNNDNDIYIDKSPISKSDIYIENLNILKTDNDSIFERYYTISVPGSFNEEMITMNSKS